METKDLEKYSSAFTLSDMEIFIFPELLYSLVLANIMSPEIWKWRDDPWFSNIRRMGPLKRIHRVKQYIMDHYDFNLDLETWGLTDKETEINRFSGFIDADILKQSNALFGYEGDKYYFDIDIRRHFGLDKYDTDIIPYWKTETVEAMNAFRFKPAHQRGAGECVSLACLYAAALFIVAGIPLEDIFLMGTPLHSQNFIMADEGILTNNRRIITRTMWYNGTELSSLARRALEHEQVTIVSHCSGYLHSVYPDATISPDEYKRFREKLASFLETDVDYEIFINFLRDYSRYQKLFQLNVSCLPDERYIPLEKAFSYEHGSKNRLGDKTAAKLICEMDEEDFSLQPVEDRIIINGKDPLFSVKPYRMFLEDLLRSFPGLSERHDLAHDLKKFVHTEPKLPHPAKRDYSATSPGEPIRIPASSDRMEILDHLAGIRTRSVTADMAFYAGRYMDSCNWEPFLKAALERNPVSIDSFKDCELQTVYRKLAEWPDESIYGHDQLALPDEVMNFKRGDGLEKAITLVNIMKSRDRSVPVHIRRSGNTLTVFRKDDKFQFSVSKDLDVPEMI